jgi:hypothetical protein
MERCPHCGTTLSIGASDCAKCGAAFGDGELVLPGSSSSKEAELISVGALKLLFGALLIFWVILFYLYAFSATAHGRKGLIVVLEWPIALLQIAYPIVYFLSLFSSDRKIVKMPGWVMLAQIVGILLMFILDGLFK